MTADINWLSWAYDLQNLGNILHSLLSSTLRSTTSVNTILLLLTYYLKLLFFYCVSNIEVEYNQARMETCGWALTNWTSSSIKYKQHSVPSA